MLSNEQVYCPPLDGLAVFPLLATVNHSCEPNAKVSFAAGASGVSASLVALRPIAAGEEVVHAYIDEHGPAALRAKRLREEYGFECCCELCNREALARPANR